MAETTLATWLLWVAIFLILVTFIGSIRRGRRGRRDEMIRENRRQLPSETEKKISRRA